MLSFSRFTPTPACRARRKGKRRERERRREQGDIPQTCQDIPRETIPNISHCDPHCVCVYECMTPVSGANLTNWLTSCLHQSRARSTWDVCVWESEKVKVRIIESVLVGETERWGGGERSCNACLLKGTGNFFDYYFCLMQYKIQATFTCSYILGYIYTSLFLF